MRAPAPLYTDAFALCQWLLGHLDADPRVLAQRLCGAALGLLDAVVLALKGREREVQLDLADERLILLRLYLRLAGEIAVLNEAQMLHALEAADQIGRQLGGWRKALEVAA